MPYYAFDIPPISYDIQSSFSGAIMINPLPALISKTFWLTPMQSKSRSSTLQPVRKPFISIINFWYKKLWFLLYYVVNIFKPCKPCLSKLTHSYLNCSRICPKMLQRKWIFILSRSVLLFTWCSKTQICFFVVLFTKNISYICP